MTAIQCRTQRKTRPHSRLVDPILSPDALTHSPDLVHTREFEAELPRWFARSVATSFPMVIIDVLVLSVCISIVLLSSSFILGGRLAPDHLSNYSLALSLCFVGMGFFVGLYPATGINPVAELRLLVMSTMMSHIVVLTLGGIFGRNESFEVLAVISSFIFACVLVPLGRAFTRMLFCRCEWWGEPVILVGNSPQTEAIYDYLHKCPHRGLRPIGVVGLAPIDEAEHMPKLGEIEDIAKVVREYRIDWVIANLNQSNPDEQQEIVSACTGLRNLIVLHNQILMPSLWSHSHECAGLSGFRIQDRLLSHRVLFLKRAVDILAIVVTAPIVLCLIACIVFLIKLYSPGPAFYGSTRVGRHGKRFKAWKLRTMVQNADQVLEQYFKDNPELRAEWEQDLKLKNDPRIIPGIGSLLRATSLDELPQLWNVFVGEMSLVGPRPILEDEVEKYDDVVRLYLRVRPGITGLWQISGRNNTSYQDRIRLVSYYVRNWSPWLDYYILLRTIRTLMRREGAY